MLDSDLLLMRWVSMARCDARLLSPFSVSSCMQLTLVVPELIWPEPDDQAAFARLHCPGLSTLLARSRLSRRRPLSAEATLCDCLGYDESVAYAPLRLLGEAAGVDAAEGYWLCADPVHLRLHQERLILADGGGLGITLDEARSVVADLNVHFAEVGRFHVATAERWYLQLPAHAELGCFDVPPLSATTGRRIGQQLPETPQTRWLRRLLNEAQMLLHRHPANAQREEKGLSTINSLWLWGAGLLPAVPRTRLTGIWSDSPLGRGLGRAAGVVVRQLPADARAFLAGAAMDSRQLLVIETLQSPVHYEDGEGYRAALNDLDRRWLAPLQKALASGKVRHLNLEAATAYGTLTWTARSTDQWQLWRRPVPLAAAARALAGDRR